MTGEHTALRHLGNAGLVACLLGTLVMLSGRYVAAAPHWLAYVGLSVIVFGWGLLGYAAFLRAALARAAQRQNLSAES